MATAMPARRWDDWNEAANDAFRRGRFAEAVELYTGAAELSGSPDLDIQSSDRAKLFANRSFAFTKVGARARGWHQRLHGSLTYGREC